MTTTSRTPTAREVANSGNSNLLPSVLQHVKIGNQLSKIKAAFTGLTSAASFDITTAASKAAAALSGISLPSGENLPPIGSVVTLRVVTGTATGSRAVTDAGGTASATLALLSDDGKTITFEAVITAFTLTYYPAPNGGMDQAYPYSAP